MKEYSIFDIIGPNMIGPSSSHTAGACRLGKIANRIAGKSIKDVTFLLHGSFGKTYKGHGTDKALIGGVLGFDPDDERIKNSVKIANDFGITFRFKEKDLGDVHPNTVKIIITKKDNSKVEILGSSTGGGSIIITEINGMEVEFTGEYTTLIVNHTDKPGLVSKVTTVLAENNINIAFMKVYRYSRGEKAFMIIETDNDLSNTILFEVEKIDGVSKTYLIKSK